MKRIWKARLFVFLRHYRHELFDEAFHQELAGLYRSSERGQPPIAPAQLALATILQAYTGVSDDEMIEATLMDRRWQLVLDCLDADQATISRGTVVRFRQRLIEAHLDRRLIERTIEVASQSQAFGSRALRAALDSSPLRVPPRSGLQYVSHTPAKSVTSDANDATVTNATGEILLIYLIWDSPTKSATCDTSDISDTSDTKSRHSYHEDRAFFDSHVVSSN